VGKMSEETVHELSRKLADKLIDHAKLKKEKNKLAELNRAERDIIELRRLIYLELQAITGETVPKLNVEE
jgi:predicted metal-binding transcription factor (methanogenesis marker protein 9)